MNNIVQTLDNSWMDELERKFENAMLELDKKEEDNQLFEDACVYRDYHFLKCCIQFARNDPGFMEHFM